MNKSKGFTLIELLVSMALLSMVVLIGSSSFALFSNRWDGKLGQFDKTMRSTQNIILTQEVLGNLMPYVAFRHDGKPVVFFEGNRNGFVGVSARSIYRNGDFAVVRFSVRQKADLKYDVLYEESPMENDMLVFVGQPLQFSKPIVLFESVVNPRFQYYGWADAKVKEDINGLVALPPRWFDSFNGVEALHAPLRASLEFEATTGRYLISSAVVSEAPGLLSRYKSSKRRGPQGNPVSPQVVDDCDC